ncbi:Nucleotidyltransferase family protein [Abeliophyllum distichum]|uniref:RNA uridylyltransferase n=1 Tax=Abeliophyllum distichum TaxID=126358 RepID=A0ABD1RVF9_9LAMI
MDTGGRNPPPVKGGDFLLQLIQKPHQLHPTQIQPNPPSQTLPDDPAVVAVGHTVPPFLQPQPVFSSEGRDFAYGQWSNSPSQPLFAPHSFFLQNPNSNLNPNFTAPPGGFNHASDQYNRQFQHTSLGDDIRKLGFFGDNSMPVAAHRQEPNIIFGSLNRKIMDDDAALNGSALKESLSQKGKSGNSYLEDDLGRDGRLNGFRVDYQNSMENNRNLKGNLSILKGYGQERSNNSSSRVNQGHNENYRVVVRPPGFSSTVKNVETREYGYRGGTFEHSLDKGKGKGSLSQRTVGLNDRVEQEGLLSDKNVGYGARTLNGKGSSNKLDCPVSPSGSNVHFVSDRKFHGEDSDNGVELGNGARGQNELDDLEEHLVNSLGLEDESEEKSDKKIHHRDKDHRSDKRGQWILNQRMRNLKRQTMCRGDINRLNAAFLAIYDSLIPADEEKAKQKQLLTVLEKLVSKEWPEARLYLYGSCANSFDFSKSDIDVCLVMEAGNSDKSEVLLKLADILQADNLQNVQALTRARVPIVKLMDPVTGISGDICMNNVLAVVNTKLLRDYAHIDVRLRQLAFIVKHWAKSRGVNETYHGTLSSYAYVLMCINFLQQRRPAILPCLQGMDITYSVTIDNVECAYFDQVEKLRDFGSRNRESIAQLVWAFFHYWAYCHDYANDVISVRTGCTLSKRAKDWTRRIGNDRHLICIEDPFELSHDLGRVVDKGPLDLLSVPTATCIHGHAADFIKRLQQVHSTTHANLMAAMGKYKKAVDGHRGHVEFEVGDFVWAVLTKDRFPAHEYNKLSSRKIGPLEIVEKINLNALSPKATEPYSYF